MANDSVSWVVKGEWSGADHIDDNLGEKIAKDERPPRKRGTQQ